MKSRADRHSDLYAHVRVNRTAADLMRPQRTHEDDPDVLSAEFFDTALTNARLSTADVAALFGVSESLVRRMRSKDARERVSFAQMLRLPPRFHVELHRVMNRRYGFGRAALAQIVEAAGALALVVE